MQGYFVALLMQHKQRGAVTTNMLDSPLSISGTALYCIDTPRVLHTVIKW